ncbi:hypothetical protein [Actinomadura sp. 9N407]|uniref:hypothetical protein n=1 Tax=Actinomadura sp. 9N407 TaxID=3375154 RepID=UPI0037974ED4
MSDEAAHDPAEAPVPRAPAPAPVPPGPEPTGDPRIDAVLARLGELGGVPVSGHVPVFEGIHQRLQELLVSADQDEPAPAAPPQAPAGAQAAPGPPRPGPWPQGPRPGSWP